MSSERTENSPNGDSKFNMAFSGALSPQGFGKDLVFEDIQFGEVVGRGAFGVVNKAIWKDMQVAVKTMEGKDAFKALNKEFVQLSKLQHENIIRLYGVCGKKPKVCLLMEFAEDGSLYDLLHPSNQDVKQCDYTIGHVISWALQCARAMEYLHGLKPTPIVHRDLKPPNMLLKELGTVIKICDFGTARPHDTSHMTSNKGSAPWMAPEVFEGPVYSEKCDVFSFSVVLWEMISRRKPFENIGPPPYRIMWAVHSGTRPPLIRGTPKILERLMICGWSKNTEIRPPFTAIVRFLEKVTKYVTGGSMPLKISNTAARRESDSFSSSETQSYSPGKTVIDLSEDGQDPFANAQSAFATPPEAPVIENVDIQVAREHFERPAKDEDRKKSVPSEAVISTTLDLPALPIDKIVDIRPNILPHVAQNNLTAVQQHRAQTHESPLKVETAFAGPVRPVMYPPVRLDLGPRRETNEVNSIYDQYPSNYSQPALKVSDEADFNRQTVFSSSYRPQFAYDRYYNEGSRLPAPSSGNYYPSPFSDYPFNHVSYQDEKEARAEEISSLLPSRQVYPPIHDFGMPMPSHLPGSASPRRYNNVPSWNSRLHPGSIPENPPMSDAISPLARLHISDHPRGDHHAQQTSPLASGSGLSSSGSSPMTSPYLHATEIGHCASTPTTQLEKTLWYIIDPDIMPVAPIMNNQESLAIYDRHNKLFNDYVELQNEMKYMIERKRDLEQQLNNEKAEQQKSSIFLETYLGLLEEKHNWSTYLSSLHDELQPVKNSRRHQENVL